MKKPGGCRASLSIFCINYMEAVNSRPCGIYANLFNINTFMSTCPICKAEGRSIGCIGLLLVNRDLAKFPQIIDLRVERISA